MDPYRPPTDEMLRTRIGVTSPGRSNQASLQEDATTLGDVGWRSCAKLWAKIA